MTTLRVLMRFVTSKPAFSRLPRPDCREEKLSRKQIGPAVMLYKALRALRPDDAYRITERVVCAEGLRFLSKSLGTMRPSELAPLDAEARRSFVESRSRRFFNAVIRWEQIEPEHVEFTVTACRFVPLCRAAGVPEIAAMFCKVDEAYFGGVEKGISLERPHTIAGGAESCLFRLRATDPGAEES